jgi:hypothetical protein
MAAVAEEAEVAEVAEVAAADMMRGRRATRSGFPVVEEFGRLSSKWRTSIEALTVQFDRAHQDMKDTIHKRLDLAQRVYVAARSADPESSSGVADDENVRFLMAYLIRDLRDSYSTAESVVGGFGPEAHLPVAAVPVA